MAMYPTWDLPILKDDLGIPADDATQDAWLTRRMNGIMDAIREYTGLWIAPVATFIDDWTDVKQDRLADYYPEKYGSKNSVLLYEYPVVSIEEALINGASIDKASVRFDARTGELKGTQIGGHLSYQNAKITYKAGSDTVPAAIYDVMLGIMTTLYGARRAQIATGGAGSMGPIDSVTIADVGQLKMASPSYGFDSSMSGYSGMDPILGPYTKTLDGYKDWRNKLGLAGRPQHSMVP